MLANMAVQFIILYVTTYSTDLQASLSTIVLNDLLALIYFLNLCNALQLNV